MLLERTRLDAVAADRRARAVRGAAPCRRPHAHAGHERAIVVRADARTVVRRADARERNRRRFAQGKRRHLPSPSGAGTGDKKMAWRETRILEPAGGSGV